MQKFNGADEAKKQAQFSGGEKLPAGAYVCKILGVKYDKGKDGNSDMITLQFDIVEGDKKDFFQSQYEANQQPDKKYKGQTRIYCPLDNGEERDNWTKTAFMRWADSFEKSNPGYIWDWDEKQWRGKLIGLIFGPTGSVINGKEVVYTEVHRPCSVDEVRSDTFYKKALDLVKRKGYTGTQAAADSKPSPEGFMALGDSDTEELPFA